MRRMLTVEFFDDPATFLSVAHDYLASDPVMVNVVSVYADRDATEGVAPAPYHWYAVVRDTTGGRVVGAAMRTAPFAPYPPYLAPMPVEGAVLLARLLHERGEHPGGGNGPLPASRAFAEESARLWGGTVEVAMAQRMWELGALLAPVGVAGAARVATRDDERLCTEWYTDFPHAARAQAGNASGAHEMRPPTREEMLARIDGGRILLWEVDGTPVNLTGLAFPVLGVGRIAPVYTPVEHRGHGYASACVAEASRRLRRLGRVCLATDVDNPVSNGVYAALGYVAVAEMANHTVR